MVMTNHKTKYSLNITVDNNLAVINNLAVFLNLFTSAMFLELSWLNCFNF